MKGRKERTSKRGIERIAAAVAECEDEMISKEQRREDREGRKT